MMTKLPYTTGRRQIGSDNPGLLTRSLDQGNRSHDLQEGTLADQEAPADHTEISAKGTD